MSRHTQTEDISLEKWCDVLNTMNIGSSMPSFSEKHLTKTGSGNTAAKLSKMKEDCIRRLNKSDVKVENSFRDDLKFTKLKEEKMDVTDEVKEDTDSKSPQTDSDQDSSKGVCSSSTDLVMTKKDVELSPSSCQQRSPDTSSQASPDSAQPSSTPLLPPCRVCREKASGFHYGVNTCEACKGFFRRSLRRNTGYKCVGGSKNCKIEPGKRNSCPQCRYMKCLAVGMSKDAIKTGRYTHEKRTKDIREIKQLQMQDRIKSEPAEEDTMVAEEMDRVIEQMDKAQKDMYGAFLSQWMDAKCIEKRTREYADALKIKSEMFGNLSGVTKEEYNQFFSQTGIDVDNRMELMSNFANTMERAVTRFISFAKNIPGFGQLSLEDQANLVKSSRFEFWIFGFYKFVNVDVGVLTGIFGRCYHISELSKLWDADFMRSLFDFSETMHNLQPTDAEIALIRCICLTYRDRCELQDPEKVEEIQWRMILCLKHLIEKTRSPEEHFLAKVFDRLVAVRSLTEWNNKVAQTIKLDWPILQKHPLLLEMMSM